MSDRTGDAGFNTGLTDLRRVVQNLKSQARLPGICPKCLQITVV